MAGLACLARALGCEVHGCDRHTWPPMSTQLSEHGIGIDESCKADVVGHYDYYVVGNVMTRGDELIEALLTRRVSLVSGPQWLYQRVLYERRVLCVAGSHGKTTTAAMLAWILEFAGMEPGFLIGGVPNNFGVSARLGQSDLFVVEGDEYDTAFFDKRSKFLHYHPHILILNNLEFDHADIFKDLDAIKTQFHHLLKTLPEDALIVTRSGDEHLDALLAQGCWSQRCSFGTVAEGGDWQVQWKSDGFVLLQEGAELGQCRWQILGEHNALNASAAIAAACAVGVPPATAVQALNAFRGVRRRLEVCSAHHGITVYDDFAHHPTEIQASIAAVRASGAARVLVAFEPRSNTMKAGRHNPLLSGAFSQVDHLFFYQSKALAWSAQEVLQPLKTSWSCHQQIDDILNAICAKLGKGDHLLIMSNGDFGGLKQRVVEQLAAKGATDGSDRS